MRYLILFLIPLLTSCSTVGRWLVPDVPPAPPVVSTALTEQLEKLKSEKQESAAALEARVRQEEASRQQAKVSALQNEIDRAREAEAKAKASGDRLAELLAEKQTLKAQADQARASAEEQKKLADDYDRQAKGLDSTIRREREQEAQVKLYWLVGILVVLGLAGFGVGIWMPLLRKWAWRLSMAAGGVAALALFTAWLIPYLIYIVGGLVVTVVSIGIYSWRADHRTAVQVVGALQKIKTEEQEYAPKLFGHLFENLETDVDKHIGRIKQKAGLAPPKT